MIFIVPIKSDIKQLTEGYKRFSDQNKQQSPWVVGCLVIYLCLCYVVYVGMLRERIPSQNNYFFA